MKYLARIFMVVTGLFLVSCVSSQVLPTQSTSINLDEQGTFDLILYGMDTSNDVKSVAVLDRVGDGYKIEASNRMHVKNIVKDQTIAQASKAASDFLRNSIILRSINTSTIYGPNGEMVGYEFRPVFNEFQVSNSFYSIWYYLDGPETIKFRVDWNQMSDPFSQN